MKPRKIIPELLFKGKQDVDFTVEKKLRKLKRFLTYPLLNFSF